MYILDTNAFYYASGISNFTYDVNKLQTFIKNNPTFISSTSLYEFFIKFRDDLSIIHQGGEFLQDNNIQIVGNVINPLPDYFSDDIMNITETEFQRICEYALKNKIDAEAKLTTILFAECLLLGYYISLMSSEVEPCDFSDFVTSRVFKLFMMIIPDTFRKIYAEGYEMKNCENHVRKCFYSLLAFCLEKGIPFIEQSKCINENEECLSYNDLFPLEEYSNATSKLSKKIQKRSSSTAFLNNMVNEYIKNNSEHDLLKCISKLQSMFNEKVNYTALQEYFYDTLTSITMSGSALWKNDLLDAIILCNVQDEHVLITYDNGVINRMEKRKSEHFKYQESIDTINELKQ